MKFISCALKHRQTIFCIGSAGKEIQFKNMLTECVFSLSLPLLLIYCRSKFRARVNDEAKNESAPLLASSRSHISSADIVPVTSLSSEQAKTPLSIRQFISACCVCECVSVEKAGRYHSPFFPVIRRRTACHCSWELPVFCPLLARCNSHLPRQHFAPTSKR